MEVLKVKCESDLFLVPPRVQLYYVIHHSEMIRLINPMLVFVVA